MAEGAYSCLAYSYLRFSDPTQESGDSVRRQIELRDAWLRRHPDVSLDTSLKLEDRGVTGYTGIHRTDDRYALAQFLKLVEKKRVRAGSYLIVENLDRLTREHPLDSIPAILNLIKAGIRIVQLEPNEMIYDVKMEIHHLMNMLWELGRGHGESKRKSGLCGAAWANKRRLAREERTPMTPMGPHWLTLVDGKWIVDKKKASAVKHVFELAAEGFGCVQIARALIREKIDPIGASGRWSSSSITHLLRNRAVLGELQPRIGRKGKRDADGEAIEGYYPRIIDDRLWWIAQGAIDKRRRHRGRLGVRVNVFAGLLHDAIGGGAYYTGSNRYRSGILNRILLNNEAKAGRGKARTFLFDVFEEALLGQFLLVDPTDLQPMSDKASRVAALTTEKADAERRLLQIESELEREEDIATLARVAAKLEKKIETLEGALEQSRRDAACSSVEDWSDAKRFFAQLKSGSKDEQLSKALALRSILRRVIDGIWLAVTPVPGKSDRYCIAQVFFKDSPLRPIYLIWYKPGNRRNPEREAAAGRWGEAERQKIDIRNASQALRAVDWIREFPPTVSNVAIPPRPSHRGKPK